MDSYKIGYIEPLPNSQNILPSNINCEIYDRIFSDQRFKVNINIKNV